MSSSSSSSSSSSQSIDVDSVWLTIEADSTGEPSGTPLATSNKVAVSTIGAGPIWTYFTFDADVSLDATTLYWFVMHGDYTASDTNYIQAEVDTGSGYATGSAGYNDGSWTISGTDDMIFRVIEDPAGENYYLTSGGNLQMDADETTMEYYSNIKDLTYLCESRVLIDYTITVTEALTWESNPTQALNDSTTLRWAGEEEPSSILFEIRTSEDNATWTDWETLISADFYMRYYQIRCTITNEDPETITIVSALTVKTDLPDIDEKTADEVTVAASGKAILFSKTFHETPLVAIDVLDGLAFLHKITNLSTSGCTVMLYQADGTTTATGNFKYHAHGI